LLVHFVPGRSAAQVRQAGAADQHVRRVRMIQRRQDTQLCQQFDVVMADPQPETFHLLLKVDPGFDRRQCQVTNRVRILHLVYQPLFDHANPALAVSQFELNQTHELSPVNTNFT
jgi:hypothetical protein